MRAVKTLSIWLTYMIRTLSINLVCSITLLVPPLWKETTISLYDEKLQQFAGKGSPSNLILSQYTVHIDYNTVLHPLKKSNSQVLPAFYTTYKDLLSEDLTVGYDLYCNMYNESPLQWQWQ